MINIRFILLAACLLAGYTAYPDQLKKEKIQPVQLILDTDIGPDFDDVGAMALMHALADSNKVDILATLSSNHHELVVPVIQILNTYFQRPDIPTGAPKSEGGVNLTSDHKVKWPEELVEKYPFPGIYTQESPDAVKIYRQILSRADDKSITICTIGFLTNLRDLLLSTPDEYSDLPGTKLVAQKVKLLVAMAGRFPSGREYNVYKDAAAGQYAINEWPTEIIFSGWEIGSKILTGKKTAEMEITNSPVKDVFEICLQERDFDGRMSWDQTAVLVAIKGHEPYYSIEQGTCTVSADGSNLWEKVEDGRHYILKEKMSSCAMASIIEAYMIYQPQ